MLFLGRPKRYGGMAYCNLDNPIWLHQATGKETQCPRIQKANASDPTNATDGLLVGKRQEIGQRTEPKQLKPHPARGQKNPSCSYKWIVLAMLSESSYLTSRS